MKRRIHILLNSLWVSSIALSSCYDSNPSPNIAMGLDWDKMSDIKERQPTDCAQVPLKALKSDTALIFIGGFLDRVNGHLRRCFDALPPLGKSEDPNYRELRAYYHWEGDKGNLLFHSTKSIQEDLKAWIKLNPTSTLVLIGHSYGGSAAMDIARHLPKEFKGPLLVATLDPVSRRERSLPKHRAERVNFWVNSYITNRRAMHELFIQLGGTWDYCKDADASLSFSGTKTVFSGKAPHSHRQALSLLIECPEGTKQSVWGYLQQAWLKGISRNSMP